jgi:hypothetical protein
MQISSTLKMENVGSYRSWYQSMRLHSITFQKPSLNNTATPHNEDVHLELSNFQISKNTAKLNSNSNHNDKKALILIQFKFGNIDLTDNVYEHEQLIKE